MPSFDLRGKGRWNGAPYVTEADAVSIPDALASLGLRRPWRLVHRVNTGYLDACVVAGREPAVTRASVEREKQWWRDATIWRRVRRVVRGIVTYISF